MYKTKNTGAGNEMWGTRRMREMLYFEECPQISGEYRQTFRGMSPNIPGNVAKHSANVAKHTGGCPATFRTQWGMSSKLLGKVAFRILSKIHDGALL